MQTNANALNWFEIPAEDLARSQAFYENIFSMQMVKLPEMMGMRMAGFPIDMGSGKVGGAVAQSTNHHPSKEGVIVYLNCNPSIQEVLDRVEEAGGQVLMKATPIGGNMGVMAIILDTEGNTVGLHAQQ